MQATLRTVNLGGETVRTSFIQIRMYYGYPDGLEPLNIAVWHNADVFKLLFSLKIYTNRENTNDT